MIRRERAELKARVSTPVSKNIRDSQNMTESAVGSQMCSVSPLRHRGSDVKHRSLIRLLIRGWEDGSAREEFIIQAWGPAFRSLVPL